MSYTPRAYQTRAKTDLFAWWTANHKPTDAPILELPTAAGKSVIIADIVTTMFAQYPDFHPRTVILVPSRELAEQNAAKLVALLPKNITVGYVSSSLGEKQHDADVIVATIGSIYKDAHLLGNIKIVLIDECHLVSPKGGESGMYRKFMTDLSRLCEFRIAGLTATPFRGDGIWLTDSEESLFTGIACKITMRELLDAGFISPLVPPDAALVTRIDASDVAISNGDYKVAELTECVEQYLGAVAKEVIERAATRRKWIAFTPSVANANTLCMNFHKAGLKAAVVCGDTPKHERIALIDKFRRGELRCLVTVLALSTGFDVPDVDCIIWCRPTKSPVLYVQGAGRGVRIADGKTNCLWLDFSDTTERLGPIDTIKGRAKKSSKEGAPFCLCDACGARNIAAALTCAQCGAHIKDAPKPNYMVQVSNAAVLSTQIPKPETIWHDITRVAYAIHQKDGKPDSLRVDYYAGYLRVASEWVCFDHTGYARQKADAWFATRKPAHYTHTPGTVAQLMDWIDSGFTLSTPTRIATRQNGKYTEIVSQSFEPVEQPA